MADIANQAMTMRLSILAKKGEIEDLRNEGRAKCQAGIRRIEELKALNDVKQNLKKQRDVAVKNNDQTALLTAENRLRDVRCQIRAKRQHLIAYTDELLADKNNLEKKLTQYREAKRTYNALFE